MLLTVRFALLRVSALLLHASMAMLTTALASSVMCAQVSVPPVCTVEMPLCATPAWICTQLTLMPAGAQVGAIG